ncbi:unnamed protein product [Brassica rapa subsp. trilocularis]
MRLAETLCVSPLYMAPEIMKLRKYDASIISLQSNFKTQADLWSIGAILFQLVTDGTPFTGQSNSGYACFVS